MENKFLLSFLNQTKKGAGKGKKSGEIEGEKVKFRSVSMTKWFTETFTSYSAQ